MTESRITLLSKYTLVRDMATPGTARVLRYSQEWAQGATMDNVLFAAFLTLENAKEIMKVAVNSTPDSEEHAEVMREMEEFIKQLERRPE